jgi:hypothetical protein
MGGGDGGGGEGGVSPPADDGGPGSERLVMSPGFAESLVEDVFSESVLSVELTPAGLEGDPTGLMAGQAAVPIRSKSPIAVFFMSEKPLKPIRTIIVCRRRTKCFGYLTP